MTSLFAIVVWLVACVVVIGLLVLLIINVRARHLENKLGAFRSFSRPDQHSGWTAGLGLYDVESLSWYRLVGLTNKPVYSVKRRGLQILAANPHSKDGELVEIRLLSNEKRYEIALSKETYNALVSWVESGLPQV